MGFWDNVESFVRKEAKGDDFTYHPDSDSYEIIRGSGFNRTISVADFEEDRRKRK